MRPVLIPTKNEKGTHMKMLQTADFWIGLMKITWINIICQAITQL